MNESTLRNYFDSGEISFSPLERFTDDVRIQVEAPRILNTTIDVYVSKFDYSLRGNDACLSALLQAIEENPGVLR